jgi:predicted lipid-binding transport protein (Tim44 family)
MNCNREEIVQLIKGEIAELEKKRNTLTANMECMIRSMQDKKDKGGDPTEDRWSFDRKKAEENELSIRIKTMKDVISLISE